MDTPDEQEPKKPTAAEIEAALIASMKAAFPGMDIKLADAAKAELPACQCFQGAMGATILQIVDARTYAMEADVYDRLMRVEPTPVTVDGHKGAALWQPCDDAFAFVAGILLAALFMRQYKSKYDATSPDFQKEHTFLPIPDPVLRKGLQFAGDAMAACATRLQELSVRGQTEATAHAVHE